MNTFEKSAGNKVLIVLNIVLCMKYINILIFLFNNIHTHLKLIELIK